MQYFKQVRKALELVIQNLFFSIRNQVFIDIKKKAVRERHRYNNYSNLSKGLETLNFQRQQAQSSKAMMGQSTRPLQSDEESVSDNVKIFWTNRNINFAIQEQSESVQDSMYESTANLGNESSKKMRAQKQMVGLSKNQS